MSRSAREYLQHMLVEADFLLSEIARHTKQEFLSSELMKRAAVRSLEIIGEAAKKVPAEFRDQHPDIEWSLMAGMRDWLIHAYFGVDYEIVWNVLESKLPALKSRLQDLLRQESPPQQ